MVEVFLGVLSVLIGYQIYVSFYFGGKKFLDVKNSVAIYTKNCNDLNEHIEELKSTYSYVRSINYGDSHLQDDSRYNMKRRKWSENKNSTWVHNCSSSVVKNANNQPFKYLCKYFDIKSDEEQVSKLEEVLNNFSAAEQGKVLLSNERDRIVSDINSEIPTLVSIFSGKRLIKELGFRDIDLSDLYFPVYTFQYVSPGGNSSSKCVIKLDLRNLEALLSYLGALVKFRKSIAGQRALMTVALRERIKARDNFTCKLCSLSSSTERNLLLEIDHIIPLSKGGVTSEENLQTLCWKCNRTKGAKIL
ncbi:HNH endonuclease [Pseudoduganella lutea]|uniref:HNH endonuclease n=1 Tax=Pseudoduganella lutea TaxID=321985 RepID=A0A4P6L0X3_9BURK|nr:HNH endonuclease signature motif containing protein [Pseudoduganella lutea]QBE64904.1 HNH endonuclease [Pseudoduganella lutea]